MKNSGPLLLRVGLSIVFLWFGAHQLSAPAGWISFLPEWSRGLPFSQVSLVLLNGWFEVVAGVFLLLGGHTRLIALFLGAHLLAIAFAVGINGPVGIRDFGLSIATLSLSLMKKHDVSLDRLWEKRTSPENPLT